jgi:hypothetical protein
LSRSCKEKRPGSPPTRFKLTGQAGLGLSASGEDNVTDFLKAGYAETERINHLLTMLARP